MASLRSYEYSVRVPVTVAASGVQRCTVLYYTKWFTL